MKPGKNTATKPTRPRQFGDPVSLAELVKRQNVSSVASLEEIIELWPVDDDPDALLAFILSERRAKRRVYRRASRGR